MILAARTSLLMLRKIPCFLSIYTVCKNICLLCALYIYQLLCVRSSKFPCLRTQLGACSLDTRILRILCIEAEICTKQKFETIVFPTPYLYIAMLVSCGVRRRTNNCFCLGANILLAYCFPTGGTKVHKIDIRSALHTFMIF